MPSLIPDYEYDGMKIAARQNLTLPHCYQKKWFRQTLYRSLGSIIRDTGKEFAITRKTKFQDQTDLKNIV